MSTEHLSTFYGFKSLSSNSIRRIDFHRFIESEIFHFYTEEQHRTSRRLEITTPQDRAAHEGVVKYEFGIFSCTEHFERIVKWKFLVQTNDNQLKEKKHKIIETMERGQRLGWHFRSWNLDEVVLSPSRCDETSNKSLDMFPLSKSFDTRWTKPLLTTPWWRRTTVVLKTLRTITWRSVFDRLGENFHLKEKQKWKSIRKYRITEVVGRWKRDSWVSISNDCLLLSLSVSVIYPSVVTWIFRQRFEYAFKNWTSEKIFVNTTEIRQEKKYHFYFATKPPSAWNVSLIELCSFSALTTCCQSQFVSGLVRFEFRWKISEETFLIEKLRKFFSLPIVFFRISFSNSSSLDFHSAMTCGAVLKAMIIRLILSLLP